MPLEPISEEAFRVAAHAHGYLRGRWLYLRHVARIVTELRPERVLEIGPGPLRFVPGSDALDVDSRFEPTHLHDAGSCPWPIPSGSYDLVIGLQCWEHFAGRQALAFLEAMRVAGHRGHLLLSFPFEWEGADALHSGIGATRIREWTLGVEPARRLLVKKPATRKRMVLLFRGGEIRPANDRGEPEQ